MNAHAYIITGPTASGKSGFAHELARQVNGVIINCDSVQIYRGIENIAASPFAPFVSKSKEQRAKSNNAYDSIDGIPYRLFSILPLTEQISVVEYLNLACREYEKAIASGRTPIFVGGTGYYINAIINGIAPMPDISDEIRARAREMVATDIVAARKMLPADFTATDPQRVARALEVFLETGRHITEFQAMPRIGAIAPNATRILISPDVDELRARIAKRVPEMLGQGALDEAKRIIDSGWDVRRAIGAPQAVAIVRGEMSPDAAIAEWITKTNQYAKRQRTWFRTQFNPDITITRTPTNADIDMVLSRN